MINLSISNGINNEISGYYKSLMASEEVITTDQGRVLDITPFIYYMLKVVDDCILNSMKSTESFNEGELK